MPSFGVAFLIVEKLFSFFNKKGHFWKIGSQAASNKGKKFSFFRPLFAFSLLRAHFQAVITISWPITDYQQVRLLITFSVWIIREIVLSLQPFSPHRHLSHDYQRAHINHQWPSQYGPVSCAPTSGFDRQTGYHNTTRPFPWPSTGSQYRLNQQQS